MDCRDGGGRIRIANGRGGAPPKKRRGMKSVKSREWSWAIAMGLVVAAAGAWRFCNRPARAEERGIAGPEAGLPWTSPSTGMEFVWVGELGAWAAKYEATNGEFRKFRPEHDAGRFGGHDLNGERHPAVQVNFADALEFADWMNRSDPVGAKGLAYRLPRETEWEKLAKCGDGREYPWGGGMPPAFGNYHGREGAESWDKIDGYDDGHPATCAVEESGENEWGLYGVGGNAWEMATENEWDTFGAWRGGSWSDAHPSALRCEGRAEGSGESRSNVGGFRVMLVAAGGAGGKTAREEDDMLRYRMQEGDTIAGIARLFAVQESEVRRANGLVEGEEVAQGAVILIPPEAE